MQRPKKLQQRAAQIQTILTVASDKAEKQQRMFTTRRVTSTIGKRTRSFVSAISDGAAPHFQHIGEISICFPVQAPGLVLIYDPNFLLPRN